MKLIQVRVRNFRNLKDVTVDLDGEVNYFIGENNIGKSNFIDALDRFLSVGVIEESDFLDDTRPIRVDFDFQLRPGEAYSGGNRERMRVACTKTIASLRMQCKDVDTGHSVDPSILRHANFFREDAPAQRAGQSGRQGLGAFFSHVLHKQLTEKSDQLEEEYVHDLMDRLDEQMNWLNVFSNLGLQADVSPDTADMLSRLIQLMQGVLPKAGRGNHGQQYPVIAMMNVVNRILLLYNSKSLPLSKLAYMTPEGKRILPMVFALDEPEIHLHPYMQRSLIRYYKRIMSNEDAPFLKLLKTCFDLDGLDGQLVIITHSTDALVDNFRNLIRFYRDANGQIRTACGSLLKIKSDVEKHLIMQFPDVKEAFYARCALLVEGTTESNALRLFAETLHVSADDYGISIIDSGGEGSLRKLASVLRQFGIPCVLVFDGDVRREGAEKPNEFYTETPCFETEIVETLIEQGAYDLLESIPPQLEENARQKTLTFAYLEKALHKFGEERMRVPRNLAALKRDQKKQYAVIYAAWFYRNKGAIIGRIIGNTLPAECIPASYRDAIERASEISSGK